MDSEKYLDVEKKIRIGQSPNDEGPFYHHAWWESYKGSIKGKLGGAIIGGVIGAVIGGIAVIGSLGWGAFAALVSAGIVYGMHEFSEIGKVVGSQAGALEQADAREAIRFSALEKRIDGLASLIKGKSAEADKAFSEANKETVDLEEYRTTHYARLNGSTKGMVFWKIALIGLAIGAVVGAALGFGGGAEHLLEVMGAGELTKTAATTISIATFGLFGASFGISRDVFRKIFDMTDLWSKGIFSHKKVLEHQIKAGKEIEKELNGKKDEPAPPEPDFNYPQSDTHFRDKLAQRALHEFDHTRATPQ